MYDSSCLAEAIALDALTSAIKEGIRHLAASLHGRAPRRGAATSGMASRTRCCSRHYNLLERGFESPLEPVAERHGMATAPYFGLAKGS